MFKIFTFLILSFLSFAEEIEKTETKEEIIEVKDEKVIQDPFVLALSSYAKDDELFEYSRGALAYLSHANDEEIFGNSQAKLLIYENHNKFKRDGDNTRRFVQFDNAKILFGYGSKEGIDESLEILKEKSTEIAMIFPFVSFSRSFHKRSNNIFHFRPTIESEIEKLGAHLNEQEGTIAVIYREGDEQQKDHFISAIKDSKKIIVNCSYTDFPLKLNDCLLTIKKIKPTYIVMLGDEKSLTNFVKRAVRTTLKTVEFIAPSYVAGAYMMKELDNSEANLTVARNIESPEGESEDAQNFRRLLNKYFPTVEKSYASFEGYLAAKQAGVIIDESIKAGKNTKEDILAYIKEKKLWKRDSKISMQKAILKKEEE